MDCVHVSTFHTSAGIAYKFPFVSPPHIHQFMANVPSISRSSSKHPDDDVDNMDYNNEAKASNDVVLDTLVYLSAGNEGSLHAFRCDAIKESIVTARRNDWDRHLVLIHQYYTSYLPSNVVSMPPLSSLHVTTRNPVDIPSALHSTLFVSVAHLFGLGTAQINRIQLIGEYTLCSSSISLLSLSQ
jgi:hypothetical protein